MQISHFPSRHFGCNCTSSRPRGVSRGVKLPDCSTEPLKAFIRPHNSVACRAEAQEAAQESASSEPNGAAAPRMTVFGEEVTKSQDLEWEPTRDLWEDERLEVLLTYSILLLTIVD